MSWYLWFLFLQDENAQNLFFFSLYAKRNGECLFKYWINLLIYWSFSLLSLRWPDDGLWLVILIWQRNRSIKPSQWPIQINYGIHYTLILLSRWIYMGIGVRPLDWCHKLLFSKISLRKYFALATCQWNANIELGNNFTLKTF